MSDTPVTKLEQRAWGAVLGIAMFLGAWWLQNQYDTTLRLQEQLAEYMRHVDDKYVQKDYLTLIEVRLGRIETKIDDALSLSDRTQYPYGIEGPRGK